VSTSPTPITREERAKLVGSRFKTTKELFNSGEETISWLIPDFIPANALVSFQSRAKAGKSTLVFHMIRAMLEGGTFLGNKIEKQKVAYLTEQPRSTYLLQLREAGINPEDENLFVLTVEDNFDLKFADAMDAADFKLLETGAKLLVIDSWGRFASFDASENEMATAPTQRRVTRIRELQARSGATVLIIQHVGKDNGRGIIDAGMGTSALAQQMDLVLSLSGEPKRREISAKKLQNANCRAIQGVGRFPLKEAIALELVPGEGYKLSSFKSSGTEDDGGTEDEAVALLNELFADTQKVDSSLVWDNANCREIGKTALNAAADKLGITKVQKGRKWTWLKLPDPIFKAPVVEISTPG
jgi:hypothetical protein